MIVLADYNLNRQAILISGSLVVSGLLDLALIRLRTFEDVGLPADSNDNESDYRERCVERLVEIVIDIQDYMGAGRLFIP